MVFEASTGFMTSCLAHSRGSALENGVTRGHRGNPMKKLLLAALVLALGVVAFFFFLTPPPFQPVIAGGERIDLSIETYGPEPRLFSSDAPAATFPSSFFSPPPRWWKSYQESDPHSSKDFADWQARLTARYLLEFPDAARQFDLIRQSPPKRGAFDFLWVSHVVSIKHHNTLDVLVVYYPAEDDAGSQRSNLKSILALREEDGILKRDNPDLKEDPAFRFPLADLEAMQQIIQAGRAQLVDGKYQVDPSRGP